MKAIIVGAGGTAREVLRGLSDHWEIVLVDSDEERLEQARKVRDVDVVTGDASSRLVLARAGLEDADAVISMSSDDAVNLEVCRIAIEAGVHQVAAVARNPDLLDDYRELHVPVFSRAKLTARRIEMQIEPRRVASAGFADGLAEAIELKISPDSPVVNRSLRDLHSESWLVAAVLRDGGLIVPHGDTTLQAGDLVTVVGAASDYGAIVNLFTSGQAQFPLDIGKKVITIAGSAADVDGHVAEAAAFIHSSAAESLVVVYESDTAGAEPANGSEAAAILRRVAGLAEGFEVRARPVPRSPGRELARIAMEEGAGLIVLPPARRTEQAAHIRASRALALVRTTGIPVLLASGTRPYRRIVVPAFDTPSGEAAARAAIDLAVFGSATLQTVAVLPPSFLSSSEATESALAAMGRLRENAAVHGVNVDDYSVEGNPVRAVTAMCSQCDLLVVGAGFEDRPGRSITRHLARRTPISMLIVPDRSRRP